MRYLGNAQKAHAYSAPGIWTPNEINNQQSLNLWDAGSDPYWSNVVFLMQPKRGDVSIVDISGTPKTITPSGSIVLSTARVFEGGASVYFPGGTNYQDVSNSAFAFGTGDYCVEALIQPSTSVQQFAFDTRTSGTAAGGVFLYYNTSTWLAGHGGATVATGGSLVVGAIYHLVVSRTSGTMYFFINGVRVGSGTSSTDLTNGNLRIGNQANGTGSPVTGNVYGIRATAHGRGYTGTTIPTLTRPFPTHS